MASIRRVNPLSLAQPCSLVSQPRPPLDRPNNAVHQTIYKMFPHPPPVELGGGYVSVDMLRLQK